MMVGERSSFTQEVADVICEELANGRSLRAICAAEDMPSTAAVCRWLATFPAFREQYARAREAQADTIFDEILHIADTPQPGERVKLDENGKPVEVTREDMIAHRRLQIDARKWMAGKLAPKKYGERIELEHSGEAPPIAITLIRQPDEGSDGA